MTGVKIFFLAFCALVKADNGDKIVGGEDAKQGQFPYQVIQTSSF